MNILIIEDNANKLKQIKNFFNNYYPECSITESRSFKDGVIKVYKNEWDLIILDMTLPTYDITLSDRGGDQKAVAGKEIMKRMLNRKIFTPVIIITQFETFDGDKISLSSLNAEFERDFSPVWKGTVFYENDDWRTKLKKLLEELDNAEGIND